MVNKKLRFVVGAIPVLAFAILFTMGAMSQRPPKTLGPVAGKLADCPGRPNCVSSQASDDAFRVAPFAFGDTPALAWDRLKAAVSSMPGARIISEDDQYLHVEFRSRIFRFVDDVELLLDVPGNKIDVRSASRLGYSDMGANRRRIEQLRIRFADMADTPLP